MEIHIPERTTDVVSVDLQLRALSKKRFKLFSNGGHHLEWREGNSTIFGVDLYHKEEKVIQCKKCINELLKKKKGVLTSCKEDFLVEQDGRIHLDININEQSSHQSEWNGGGKVGSHLAFHLRLYVNNSLTLKSSEIIVGAPYKTKLEKKIKVPLKEKRNMTIKRLTERIEALEKRLEVLEKKKSSEIQKIEERLNNYEEPDIPKDEEYIGFNYFEQSCVLYSNK